MVSSSSAPDFAADAKRALAWLRDVPAIDVIGFSLTGFGDPSFGKLLQDRLQGAGWTGCVREISYGGLSVNALAGLIRLAAAPVVPRDVVALELATSFFSQHKYTLDQARPLVFAIARHFAASGRHRVFFLNLFRADLDDQDCVVQAIQEASTAFGIPVLDLKTPFRKLSVDGPFGTTDGIHPDTTARQMIADAMTGFLAEGPWPPVHGTARPGPEYAYLDLLPLLPDLPRYEYEARGKRMSAVVLQSGQVVEVTLPQREHVVGYCFLYGPETGFIEVTIDDQPTQELITFDEHSYYRRVGFRPLDARASRIRLRVPPKVREVALVRPTNLQADGRCEYVCGFVVKRAPSKVISGADMNAPRPTFDSLSYWRTRHEQYLTDTKGVGNATLDSDQNDRIYAAIEQYVGAIAAHLKARGARRVLDLGCGIGMLANAFVSQGLEYTGVDISDTAIGIASGRTPQARFLVGNIADLPFAEPFDIIIERTVFIHLVEDGYWKSTLKQVKRSLSSTGVFILIDHLPSDAASAPQSATHVKFRLRGQYEIEFAQLGLRFDAETRADIARHVALNEHTHIAGHA